MNAELIKQAKEAVTQGRENGRIVDISEAFKKYSVADEMHKGKIEYFKNEGNAE